MGVDARRLQIGMPLTSSPQAAASSSFDIHLKLDELIRAIDPARDDH